MLDKFKKFFKENEDVVVADMTQENDALVTLQAAFDEQAAALQAALSQIDEMKAAMQEYAALAEQAEQEAIQAQADAHKVKMDARLAVLSQEVGDERAAKVLAATEGMDDAQFTAIADALKMSIAEEANSAMFNEAGVDATAHADANKQESLEMKKLKQKYAQK